MYEQSYSTLNVYEYVYKVSSAVADHFKSGHFFDFENSQVIYKQTHNRKRKIAEALLIHNNHTIPGNKSSYELSLFV